MADRYRDLMAGSERSLRAATRAGSAAGLALGGLVLSKFAMLVSLYSIHDAITLMICAFICLFASLLTLVSCLFLYAPPAPSDLGRPYGAVGSYRSVTSYDEPEPCHCANHTNMRTW